MSLSCEPENRVKQREILTYFARVYASTNRDKLSEMAKVELSCQRLWGKRAEQVGELEAGELVLVEGKLRRMKKGEGWETVVASFDAQPLRSDPAGMG